MLHCIVCAAPRPTQPAGTGNWIEPQLAQGLPWLGVTNTEDQHQQQQQQQVRTEGDVDVANCSREQPVQLLQW